MTYQLIYSSEATMPMPAEELEALLVRARHKNGIRGISGALVYAEGMFLQILEGESAEVHALMADITKDLRHRSVTVLREGEIPAPRFSSWGMAYVSATPEEVASWAGVGASSGSDTSPDTAAGNVQRAARFAQEIVALLASRAPGQASRDLHGQSQPIAD